MFHFNEPALVSKKNINRSNSSANRDPAVYDIELFAASVSFDSSLDLLLVFSFVLWNVLYLLLISTAL